ncbi:MAG: YdjY domain-containing protein [Phycisphaerales bacterium JB059]
MSRVMMMGLALGAAMAGCAARAPIERGEASPRVVEMRAAQGEAVEPAPPTDATESTRDERAGGASGLREVFEHVRVDAERRVVEFDGIVPIDAHHKETPDVYLEVVACTKGTREHEALVMTEARPSHVHAALLLIGLEPGAPGAPSGRGREAIAPTGDPVEVRIAYVSEGGDEVEADAAGWIVHAETGEAFETAGWVFSGSRIVTHRGREVYDADGTGLVIGLAMFGNARVSAPAMGGATVALADGFSPEAGVAEPVWIANRERVPRFGTRVVVRVTPAR